MNRLVAKLSQFVVMLSITLGSMAFAKNEVLTGFIEIKKGHELYVEYNLPKEGMPTVVLVNGLTYTLRQWDDFVAPLVAKGIGVLRYDPIGMGKTLLKYAPITSVIPYDEQVKDLKILLEKLEVPAPYNMVGLSYGGGIIASYTAEYPQDIKNLILMAPFTRPLDDMDRWIQGQIWATRKIFPFNPYSDDDLYDYFLRQIVYSTYPPAEPIVLENPFKLEAVYRLVQGIRKARPIDVTATIPQRSLHLMIARKDQYINTSVLNEYWDAVPVQARASRLYINDSEHKMVEDVPNFTASWVLEILSGNERLYKGQDFEGYPYEGTVRSEDGTIRVGREK